MGRSRKDDSAILADMNGGELQRDIAVRHGISRQRVGQIARKNGIDWASPRYKRVPDTSKKTGPWNDKEKSFLRFAWLHGFTCREIAASLNRSRDGVIGQAHRMGLPERPSPIRRAA